MASKSQSDVRIRPATPADSAACGEICYRAFSAINAAHNFPCDLPGPEAAVGMLRHRFSTPSYYCIVAEIDGRVVGSNVLDERSIITGVGPITIDPSAQNRGVGRSLMQAVMNRSEQRHAPGIRLVQAAFHNRSLSLYTSLGFDIREPLSCVGGEPRERGIPGYTVRSAEPADLEACNALARRVHGFDRGTELKEAIGEKTARVVERGGRVTGYTSELAYLGHSTAETNPDLQALIASAESLGTPGILVPSRNTALLRWCLGKGLRIVHPDTLMSIGLYNEPAGAWLPSIIF